jgi:hypothetical protein
MTNKILGIIEIKDEDNSKFFRGLFQRPTINVDPPIEIPFLGASTFVYGRKTWSNVELEFYDCCIEDSYWIEKWLRQETNYLTNIHGYAPKRMKIITISVIEPRYNDEKWTLYGAQIISYSTEIKYDFESDESEFSKLTRTILIEKINNPTMQIIHKVELVIDKANLGYSDSGINLPANI